MADDTGKPLPKPPYLGAAYYPEAWPQEQMDAEIALMRAAGMNVMRMAEFAWAQMEPEEGRFDFAWLHRAVDKLAQAGIASILCTPTATPPSWLTTRYPEVLQMTDCAEGVRTQHGGRQHACPNNPVYRKLCAGIVTRLAKEFGQHPYVIGWQVDNEVMPIKWRGCRCPVCVSRFHDWLQAKYGAIESLNQAWGLNLWSQAYHAFDQVPFPRADTWHHPSLQQAWVDFQSDTYVEYVNVQAAILQRLTVMQPVGTDMMMMASVSHRDMNRDLDVVQFNHYHNMENLWESLAWFDYLRSLKAAAFWNTETSPCWDGGTAAHGYREPGFNRANSWLPIAMGGEANLYWLWRQHWSGQELMHGAVLSSCGRPLHVFEEVQEIARGFRAAASFLDGTRPVLRPLALHFSMKDHVLFDQQPMTRGFQYLRAWLDTVYRPLLQAQLRPDVIHPAAALDLYRVVVSPYLAMLDEGGLRERLRCWIEAGGTWVAGPLTDVRTLEGTKYTHAPFGTLEEWAGVHGRYDLPADPRLFNVRWPDGTTAAGSAWFSGFEPRGAEVLATYADGPLAGLAAITRRRMGKGQVIVLGTMPPPAELLRLLGQVTDAAGIAPVAQASANLLVAPRAGAAGEGLVVVEFENRSGSLTLDRPRTDLLTGQPHAGAVTVPPYGVLVLR
jgi:beta-galactosidase GanA